MEWALNPIRAGVIWRNLLREICPSRGLAKSSSRFDIEPAGKILKLAAVVKTAYLHYPGKGMCDCRALDRPQFIRQIRKEQENGLHPADCDCFAPHRAS